MKDIIDLSHPIRKGMPVYPGTNPIILNPEATIINDGYRELSIGISSHTGTHIDVAAHLFEQGKALSDYSIEKFQGAGIALEHSKENPLTINRIDANTETLQSVDFVLLNTKWDMFWGQAKYFAGFPTLATEVVEYLCSFKLKGLGVDSCSLDTVNSSDLPNHYVVLSKDMIIIENLTGVSNLINSNFYLSCYPLPINNGDGSPVRAVAHIRD